MLAQFRVYQYNLTNDPDEAYFTLEAVKRINDLMNEEHKQGTVSDALMMAVAAMVNKDVSNTLGFRIIRRNWL